MPAGNCSNAAWWSTQEPQKRAPQHPAGQCCSPEGYCSSAAWWSLTPPQASRSGGSCTQRGTVPKGITSVSLQLERNWVGVLHTHRGARHSNERFLRLGTSRGSIAIGGGDEFAGRQSQ